MKFRWSYTIVVTLLTCSSVRPDTITMKDNLSINGSLVGMANGVIRIKVRFPSEEKEVWIPVKDARSIEFNSLTFNSDAPPKIVGFGAPPEFQDNSQKKPPAEDVIVLRGGGRRPCNLVDIDADRIQCDPNGNSYARDATLRILFGSE